MIQTTILRPLVSMETVTEAREGSLGFIAPGTGRRPDKPTSVAPGLPVSGEFCAPAINCRTPPVLKRLDQEPREEGVFTVALILQAPGEGCGWYQLCEVENDRASFRRLGRFGTDPGGLIAIRIVPDGETLDRWPCKGDLIGRTYSVLPVTCPHNVR
jgi:hypothetical protein